MTGTRSHVSGMDRSGNLGALQQVPGHALIETTQRYARMSNEVVMREAERIAGGVGDA